MAKTHTLDIHGYRLSKGIATGTSEDAFELSMEKNPKILSLVQLPILSDSKAEFLHAKEQLQIGEASSAVKARRRLPWWYVMAQLEQYDSSKGRIEFEYAVDNKCQTSIRSFFSDVFRHTVKPHASGSYVFTIPNCWEEKEQDKFLRFLPCNRSKAHLLWQPVAILMAFLKNQTQSSPKVLSGKNVLVLDFGNSAVEATRLRLKTDGGYTVPVRQNCKPDNSMRRDYLPVDYVSAKLLGRSLPSRTSSSILLQGIVSRVLTHANEKSQQFIVGSAGAYHQINLNSNERSALIEEVLSKPQDLKAFKELGILKHVDPDKMNLSVAKCIQSEVTSWLKDGDVPDIVLISGALSDVRLKNDSVGEWIKRQLLNALPSLKHSEFLLADEGAASIGALLYGQREQLGLPTYFDVLPKYEVYVMQRALGEMPRVGATTLVENAEVRGGEVWKPKNPIDGFAIRALSTKFELYARREDEAWKVIPADKFTQLEQDEPVLIYPEMRPASGFAVVTIRPKDNPEIFGKKQSLVLRWDRAVDKEPEPSQENFAYPFIEWTKGRFAENNQVEQVIRRFVNNRSKRQNPGPLSHEEVQMLERVMVPYREDQKDYTEPYRGAFGNRSFRQSFDKELIQSYGTVLLNALHASQNAVFAGAPQQRAVKYLGFMYSYAPKDFRNYLKKSFRSGYVPTMNQIIAAGRTFKTSDEVNSLLEYVTSLKGLPTTNLGWYWWAFFRCMYYNPSAANANYELAGKYILKMASFLNKHKSRKVPLEKGPGCLYNQLKFCLCGVLYGLRVREVNPNFLSPRTRGYKKLNAIIGGMKTKVVFLQAMLNAMPPERRREARRMGLNGVVLEFLNNKASAETVSLLADFTKTIK